MQGHDTDELSAPDLPLASHPDLPAALPGVHEGNTDALCDHPRDFVALRNRAYDWCNRRLRLDSIVRDYHMHRALRGLYERLGSGGEAVDSTPAGERKAGHVAFGGGTSLVSARCLTERDSEDIDLLLIAGENVSKGQFKRIRRDVLEIAAQGAAPDVPFDQHERSSTGYVGRAHLTVGEAHGYLKVEVAYVSPMDDDLQQQADLAAGRQYHLWEPTACQSLMGRAADDATRERYPELRPFDAAAVAVPYIAANKFLALHKRAAEGKFHWVAERGRDAYDLWAIAQSPHAAEVRALVAPLSEHVVRMWPNRETYPRPEAGFGSSPCFRPGAEGYDALRRGFKDIRDLIWGRQPPPFDKMLEAVRSLD